MSDSRLVDARIARQQLQDLAARGFPLTFLGRACALSPQALGGIRQGHRPRIRQSTAQAIGLLYIRLDGTGPEDHSIPPGHAAWTRLIAARADWDTSERSTA